MADAHEEALSSEGSRRLWECTFFSQFALVQSLVFSRADTMPKALSKCISIECQNHEFIDDALREWLNLTARICHATSDIHEDVMSCASLLLESQLFLMNKDYVRTQIIHSVLQEDDADALQAIACLLYLDGRNEMLVFSRMVNECGFSRLLALIKTHRIDSDQHLHRLLLLLMYEMVRMERLKVDDLVLVNDEFIHDLFGAVEGMTDDVQNPFHHPMMRVLLVLNEQYMLASTDFEADSQPVPPQLTNRVVKCLSLHGPFFRSFGENVILLLNRETETSLQLLILKLLYLLFTTRTTFEYFYTNDLRVLVDVIIRNLMDLPDEKKSLRHTYLRVMHPLLAHTQLSQSPHYKRDEIVRVLGILRGSQNAHFAPVDQTTLRLVDRVTNVKWLGGGFSDDRDGSGQAEVARKMLGISVSSPEGSSSASVGDMAGVRERPGVQTPSRERGDVVGKTVPNLASQEVVGRVDTKRTPPLIMPRTRQDIQIQPPQRHLVNGIDKRIPPRAPPPRRSARMKILEQSFPRSKPPE